MNADAQHDGAGGDGLKDAALGIEAGRRREREDGEGSGNVHEGDERAGAEDCARQSTARIAHLFGHAGNQLEAGEREGDLRPEVDGVPIPRGTHVGERELRDRAVAQADQHGHAGEDQQRQIGADAARVLQPFADVEADDVEHHRDQKQGQRNPEQKRAVLRQRSAAAEEM